MTARNARAAARPAEATAGPGPRAGRTSALAGPGVRRLEAGLRRLATVMEAHPGLAGRLAPAFALLELELARAEAAGADRVRALAWSPRSRRRGRA